MLFIVPSLIQEILIEMLIYVNVFCKLSVFMFILTFLDALTILSGEIVPDSGPVLASPTYRKSLAIGHFYKVGVYIF